MIGLDTNVLIRIFTADDTAQTKAALAFLSQKGDESIYISVIVLVEFVWTLRRFYKLEKNTTIAAVEVLLRQRELVIEARAEVMTALGLWRTGKADFSDYLLGSLNRSRGAMPTYTFDQAAAESGMFALLPA
jgi:predicted nucleic-acid-binding protein